MAKDINRWDILLEQQAEVKKFLKIFKDKKCDPRKKRGRLFSIGEIFLIILCVQICGFESLREYELYGKIKREFLQKFYPYRRGTPTKSTFARILALFDPVLFETIFLSWQTFSCLSGCHPMSNS